MDCDDDLRGRVGAELTRESLLPSCLRGAALAVALWRVVDVPRDRGRLLLLLLLLLLLPLLLPALLLGLFLLAAAADDDDADDADEDVAAVPEDPLPAGPRPGARDDVGRVAIVCFVSCSVWRGRR